MAAIAILAWPPQSAGNVAALNYVVPLFGFIGLGVFAPQLVAGVGLLTGQGWARWLMIGVSAQWLLALPVGTMLGAFGLWVLLRPEAVSTPGAEPHADPPPPIGPILKPEQVKLLLLIAATGAAMALALFIGFQLDRHPKATGGPVYGPNGMPLPVYQPPPAAGDDLFALPPVAMIVIVLAAIAVGIAIFIPDMLRNRTRREVSRRYKAEQLAKRAERVAALEADPQRSAYAARVAAGESWSDAQVDYDRDPGVTVTCEHLRPIERAMRRDGVKLRLDYTEVVSARCRIDAARLERDGHLNAPVRYAEDYQYERAGDRYPIASIGCEKHRASVIRVLHPDDAAGAPVWPGAPGP